MMKSWLDFDDLDLIFKVTAGLKLPNLSQNVLVCTLSHEIVGRFQPDLHGYNIGTDFNQMHRFGHELSRFW